jgi:multiple sugar transport system permease protein
MGSLKTDAQISTYPPIFIFTPTFANYQRAFLDMHFFRYTLNSIIISVGATGVGLALGLPAAHAIGRFRMTRLSLLIFGARMVPFISYAIPWFIIFRDLGLYDTYFALIFINLLITLPLSVMIMIGFFEDVPKDYEDAALIDGCSRFQAFYQVILPCVRPGIAATVLLSFIFSWNNFLFPLIFSGERTKPLPMMIYNFIEHESLDLGGMFAASFMIMVPILILVFTVQRHLIKGLTIGGLKG